ncbi:hypothetical protein AB434_0614 [Heyndrickxia coagulans]|jgi:hypothetical protein|uniref:Uncharacterized protein n=1 Tax=Heyndrickxia coagulans TaxID=1398 RepID=A0AAN0T296_HEYCO|nr:hypothetical protein SB48_HM08orf00855 [Heyndrickxia coagulans]AKN53019.1 hypothetical protein AB434_0614 [Heyndrickxia coagulans]KYC62418.1 hypothetical protein B4100_1889 [Heyndrickxia coagulans]KYC84896.1 hypothetical protein B4096_1799 [Heyndrickxia coagulans]
MGVPPAGSGDRQCGSNLLVPSTSRIFSRMQGTFTYTTECLRAAKAGGFFVD